MFYIIELSILYIVEIILLYYMGCSSSIPMSQNIIDEIKDIERINVKDKYNKSLLLDKSTYGRMKTDTKQEIKDQVTMWGLRK